MFAAKNSFLTGKNYLGPTAVEYLVVAGGGGGGANFSGGGGGGGFRTATGLSVVGDTAYTVTIGGGGSPSVPGSNSVFASIISIGGGEGGHGLGSFGFKLCHTGTEGLQFGKKKWHKRR